MNATQPSPDSQPQSAARCVAVYGTLRQSGSNDITRLLPAPRFVGRTTLRGQLYHLGGYPGLVLDPAGDAVVAEVYAVSTALEAKLDAIEAEYPAEPDEYAKRECVLTVQTEQGERSVACFIYEINARFVEGRPLIASGDWLAVTSASNSKL